MQINRQFLKHWNACYKSERVDQIIPVGSYITAVQLVAEERVPLRDRLWVMCRLLADKDVQLCVTFANYCRDKAAAADAAARWAADAAARWAAARWAAARWEADAAAAAEAAEAEAAARWAAAEAAAAAAEAAAAEAAEAAEAAAADKSLRDSLSYALTLLEGEKSEQLATTA